MKYSPVILNELVWDWVDWYKVCIVLRIIWIWRTGWQGRELLETGDDNTEECDDNHGSEDDDGRFGQIFR